MSVRVAFTGSFDPVHEGHKYVVSQAQKLGLEVVVIVANNVEKMYRDDLNTRAANVRLFIGRGSESFECHACDSENIGGLIKYLGCAAIIRGVRNEKDFVYEQMVADFNRSVNHLETIYIPCPPRLRDVSSTKIRNQNLTPHH